MCMFRADNKRESKERLVPFTRVPRYSHGFLRQRHMGAHSGKKISGNHQDRYYSTKPPRPLVVGSDSAGCGNNVGARKDPADHTRTHGIVIEDLLRCSLPTT
ncbi:hypothetical protein BDV38DRAFT_11737 [Aspergillus pseudotamarii]|uniref:Uncharacterized protein n=1 Tax=Aspergillus pseudotamarii TaxID=132259 RepID=A0A5N6SD05_ASPPS|nr:uncharacterized protein BDV38DRAFT_11737 [Aspergillus pseudotamarii]KAE8131739.1 hypothetical protein BDV38DRAFT_11737 [Aspergillus pseudotamarii]